MPVQIQLRGDTAANWTSADPTLALREVGLETDTRKFKIGDGSTAWTGLAYAGGGGTPDLDTVLAASSGQDIADALTGAASPDASNVFATIADLPAGGSVATDAIWDAKGDLAAGTGADTAARLAVAANGSSLRAASGTTTGLEWQLNNLAASTAPAVTDDSGDGYSVGSRWIDTTADKEYVCLDASSGAAVWTETTGGGASATLADVMDNGAATNGDPITGDSGSLDLDTPTTVALSGIDGTGSDPGIPAAIVGGDDAHSGSGAVMQALGADGAGADGKLLLKSDGSTGDAGQVLTADGSGKATWEDASGMSGYSDYLDGLSGLVHRWKFDEASGNFADSVGSLTLTVSGSFTYSVAGAPVGGAVTFGASAKADSSGLGSIPTGANARTFVAVLKPAVSTSKQAILSYGSSGSTREWWTQFLNDGQTDTSSIAVWNDDLDLGYGEAMLRPNTSDGGWHIVIASYSGNLTLEILWDFLYGCRHLSDVLATGSGGNFRLGQDSTDGNQSSMTIDDLAVINRRLAEWEMRGLASRLGS